MKANSRPGRLRGAAMRGLSLIELMVGIVIGMLAVVVLMQIFALSEGNKRNTTGTGDAQTNGALALTELERDIRQAGFNISNFAIVGCNITPPAPATWTINSMAPVVINPPGIPAGDSNTDTVMVAYGNNSGSSEGDRVITQSSPTVFTVTTPQSFNNNASNNVIDNVIAVPAARPSPCTLLMAPALAVTTSPPNVTVGGTGTAGMIDGTLFNLGPAPVVRVYRVYNGALTQCNFLTTDCRSSATANWVPIGDNIVSLRAVYGRDTSSPMDMVADTFDQTTPAGTDACGWTRILAVRLVLVARNAQFNKQVVTAASSPDWAASAVAPIDLGGSTNWNLYRYRTFETAVPLRNMTWQGKQPSCP